MPTPFVKAERLQKLPPYLFAEIDKKKKAALAAGRDVINLGVGDPDRPTPAAIIKSLQHHVENPAFHQYALDQGAPELRQSIAAFCKSRYGLDLDPASEILPLIGSKEGIAHFPLAVLNAGEISLVPDPCYPVYRSSSMFAGADVYTMPLEPSLGFRPDLDAIPHDVFSRARLMFLNYPNNPSGGTVDLAFFQRVVDLASSSNFVVAQDAAYNEMYFDAPAPSLLQVPGAKDVAIEFHSLSKTFNMTGWRVGFAVGHPQLVAGLASAKGNLDSGVVSAIQAMGTAALKAPASLAKSVRSVYKQRRAILVGGLKKAGFSVFPSQAAFYVWVKVPKGHTSASFCSLLLDKAGIVATPGNGFGAAGEGYFRLTLTAPEARLKLAVKRLTALKG